MKALLIDDSNDNKMARGETVSRATKWTDAEKSGVFFSIIDQLGGKIDWNRITPPMGRSIKAMQCMLDTEKKKVGHTNEKSDEGPPTTPNKPSAPKPKSTPRKRGPKAKDGLGEDGETPLKSSPKKKRKLETSEDDDDDGETPQKSSPKKKRKVETSEDGNDGEDSRIELEEEQQQQQVIKDEYLDSEGYGEGVVV